MKREEEIEIMKMNEVYHIARKSLDRDFTLYISGKGINRNISVNPFFFSEIDNKEEYKDEMRLFQTVLVKNNFNLFKNGIILSEIEIPDKYIPVFRNTTRKIEINRYGDIINSLHIYNIEQIAKKNPLLIFEVKTKQDKYLSCFDVKNIKTVKK